jgi:transcriptional regulator GlxA family with amidase domain
VEIDRRELDLAAGQPMAGEVGAADDPVAVAGEPGADLGDRGLVWILRARPVGRSAAGREAHRHERKGGLPEPPILGSRIHRRHWNLLLPNEIRRARRARLTERFTFLPREKVSAPGGGPGGAAGLTGGDRAEVLYFLPMGTRVLLVGFDGADGLDLFGPAEVFAGASRRLGAPVYEVIVAAAGGGGAMRLTSGASVAARDLATLRPQAADTVIVAGGDDRALAVAAGDATLARWLVRAAGVVRRIGSVCDGAFILASAGILDGKRATTHWSSCERLARRHPAIDVDREAIFVHDGRVWTSAGVTTGIDMALSMVEEDHGRQLADIVAAHLVMPLRRPGFQSQLSEELVAQTSASDPLGPVVAWVLANLRAPLDVNRLARQAGMSARSLHRRCLQSLGITPAKLIEKLRVEQARTLLATTQLGTKAIAARCGFGPAPRMTRAFERALGVAPQAYRSMLATPRPTQTITAPPAPPAAKRMRPRDRRWA